MALIVLAVFALRPAWVVDLDDKVCDLLTRRAGAGTQSNRVAIVGIDDDSLTRFGRWPWPRDLLGALVDRVADAGAAVVALDLLLSEPDRSTPWRERAPGATNDDVLAAALARVPTVVGYSIRFGGAPPAPECRPPALPLVLVIPRRSAVDPFLRGSGFECTVPVIARTAAGSGILNIVPDRDGKLRTLPIVAEVSGRYYPSLALAALNAWHPAPQMQLRANGRGAESLRLDNRIVPLEGGGSFRLRFRGPPGTFPHVSAADLLAGRAAAGSLSGKIVVLGPSAYGLQGVVPTAVHPLFPDLELHATVIDNFVQGDFLHRPAQGYVWELLLAAAAGIASALILTFIRPLWASLITFAIGAALWAGAMLALSGGGVLLSPVPATAVLASTFAAVTLLNYRAERRRADFTERQLASARQSAEQLRLDSESRYRRLVENVTDAIITTSPEGRLVFANLRFREWFGLADRDISALLLEDYVAPEWREAVREHSRLRLAGLPAPDQFEFEAIRADGTRMWIEALVATVEEGGRIVGIQSALRDETERKRMEAQYLQAQKLESVGRLAGGVAHDFNNLLTVINGYSDMLAARLKDERALEMIHQIRTAGERAAELTRQLLTFSRKQVAQRKPLDLSAVVEEVQKMLRRVVGEDVEVVSRLSPSLGLVMADPLHLHQVLMNLVVNARDSMPEGGRLTIETRNVDVDELFSRHHPELAPGPYVYLGVSDTGTGIPDDIKPRIFDPFFTTKEKGKGTGLGLATVYSIVRQSEGAIWVDSEPGVGTTFHIYLPLARGAAQAATITGATVTAARGSETILLVEDQDGVRELIARVLKGHGYEVLQAADGPSALALASRHAGTIHLLITDVILPQMNGRLIADALRVTRPATKVLYVSGYSEDIIARQGVLEPGLAYLPKPFTAEALLAKVRETLAGAG